MRRLFTAALLVASPLAAAAEYEVGFGAGFTYSPAQLEIHPGDTVRFSASGSHPLRSDATAFGCNQDCVITFPALGEYGFYCLNHGGPGGLGMSGVVRVLPSPRIHADGFEG